MGTAKKCLKFSDESETLELEDRISNLPESLIVHILSFLPTKHAVGTSALSKLWKKQWTYIPNLDFDDTVLMNTQNSRNDCCDQPSFVNFVDRVLDLHKVPQIGQFRLKCHQRDTASHVNTWISTALASNVRKLDLDLDLHYMGEQSLPCEIFTSSTLAELRLGSLFVLNIPSLVCLPNLKAIYLWCIKITDESYNRLFSGCPVLEDLTVINCMWSFYEGKLNISSPTVKRLAIDNSRSVFSVKLNTPRLEHLNYIGQIADGFLTTSPEFLAKVYFHIRMPSYLAIKEAIKVLAQGISNVQFLYLSGEIMEAFKDSRLEFHPFRNLRTLVIGYNRNGAWKMLPRLLEKCPHLKHLALNDGLYGQERHDKYFRWVPPKVVPACLVLQLEVITVHAFKGYAEELKMINYFLINSKALKKLIVKSAMSAPKERIVREKLLEFTRAKSLSDCEVVVS